MSIALLERIEREKQKSGKRKPLSDADMAALNKMRVDAINTLNTFTRRRMIDANGSAHTQAYARFERIARAMDLH